MRTTLKQLREAIERSLDEMPLADVLPLASDKPTRPATREKRPSDRFTPDEWEPGELDRLDREYDEETAELNDPAYQQAEKDKLEKNRRQVQRFYTGGKFRDSAVKAYRHLKTPIYIVPRYTPEPNVGQRARLENNSKLGALGLSAEKVKELETALRDGAAVFIVQAMELKSETLPTPWMTIHALFDAGDDSSYFSSSEVFKTLYGVLEELDAIDRNFRDDQDDSFWNKMLTMKSARDGAISGRDDAGAEIMTQQILTTAGFTYKHTKNDDVNKSLENIKKLVSSARSEFEQAISGQILDVEVAAFFV